MFKPPRAPAGLAQPGQKLWKSILTEHKLSTWELEILEGACRTKDLIATLDGDIATSELKTTGSMGQEILNDSVKERRMQEAHLIKLLTTLKLPNVDELAGNKKTSKAAPRSPQSRQEARARWETPAK